MNLNNKSFEELQELKSQVIAAFRRKQKDQQVPIYVVSITHLNKVSKFRYKFIDIALQEIKDLTNSLKSDHGIFFEFDLTMRTVFIPKSEFILLADILEM